MPPHSTFSLPATEEKLCLLQKPTTFQLDPLLILRQCDFFFSTTLRSNQPRLIIDMYPSIHSWTARNMQFLFFQNIPEANVYALRKHSPKYFSGDRDLCSQRYIFLHFAFKTNTTGRYGAVSFYTYQLTAYLSMDGFSTVISLSSGSLLRGI